MNLYPSSTNTNAYNPSPSSVSNLDKILQQHSSEKLNYLVNILQKEIVYNHYIYNN